MRGGMDECWKEIELPPSCRSSPGCQQSPHSYVSLQLEVHYNFSTILHTVLCIPSGTTGNQSFTKYPLVVQHAMLHKLSIDTVLYNGMSVHVCVCWQGSPCVVQTLLSPTEEAPFQQQWLENVSEREFGEKTLACSTSWRELWGERVCCGQAFISSDPCHHSCLCTCIHLLIKSFYSFH